MDHLVHCVLLLIQGRCGLCGKRGLFLGGNKVWSWTEGRLQRSLKLLHESMMNLKVCVETMAGGDRRIKTRLCE